MKFFFVFSVCLLYLTTSSTLARSFGLGGDGGYEAGGLSQYDCLDHCLVTSFELLHHEKKITTISTKQLTCCLLVPYAQYHEEQKYGSIGDDAPGMSSDSWCLEYIGSIKKIE